MSTGPSVSTAASSEDEKKEQRLLDVMFLCDEWKSSKGGLSTFNREFVINLAEITTGSMKIYCYVSRSDDRDREDAKKHGVNLINAETVPGSRDPLDWLKVPPPELQHPHVVIGHGRKLGTPACHIVRAAKCKWIQFVHVFSEDLGKYKKTTTATIDTIEENEEKHKMEIELCKAADAVVAVGSRLQQKYSRCLLNVKVEIITPGIFGKFSSESKLALDRSVVKHFNVSMFGRATFEDLSLKGYDVVANAIGPLGKNFELTFVGSSPGEHRKVEQWFLDNTGVSRNQLTIRGYCSDPEELKLMFYQSDLVALPSRTEGFGLVALEAISAGIPILVSGESGIAEALREVEGGNTVIVELDEDAVEWARRISEMAEESAEEREAKARRLRDKYREVYSWRTECEKFKGMIEKVVENANDGELNINVNVGDFKPEEQNVHTGMFATESVGRQEVQQPRAFASIAALGSVSYPQTEHLQALREEVCLLFTRNLLQNTPLQSSEELNMFMECVKEMQLIIKGFHQGSLVITVKCESLQILEELWTNYSSGHLGEVVQNCFVTEKILKELNLALLKLKTTMDIDEYNACKVYFERLAFRGSSPILEMPTTGHNKEGEEPQETMKEESRRKRRLSPGCSNQDPKHPRVAFVDLAVKQGSPTDDELEELGNEIAEKWMTLGRRLGVKEPNLQDINQNHRQLREKGYYMLMDWKQENGSTATYQILNAALQHKLVQRKDLAEKICHRNADDELNITIDVEDQKPAESNNQTTTPIMRSVSHPDTESLQALREEFFLLAGKSYLKNTPPQNKEERDEFMEFLENLGAFMTRARQGSLVITVKCKSLQILEELWREYLSGHMGEVVQNCFVTEKILKELNLAELKLKTTMDIEEYNACKLYLEKVALRDALSAQSYFISTEDGAQLERRRQNTEVVELEEVKKLEGRLKTFTLQEEKCILPPSEEELEELLMKLQSMKGSLSIFEMSTTGHNKEGEEPQETMKDQKLNLKVDVEHVKLADQDTCSTASVSTMEPAECQKASIASGAYRKRPSDTDLEDLQPLEKKVLCLIAMNYLPTTPPEGRDEHSEFQEYLRDMKVHITCVSVGIRLVITVKCDSLKSLEELWEDYSGGLLGKMVRDCLVTEKILKALNLAELKLKTTMDIEDYNACKLYFEKDPLRGTSLSAKLSTAGNGKELEGKLKTLKLQKEKRTWPVPEFSASDPEEELAELRLKLQGMEVTSPSAVYFTTGHEKEKILRHETLKLQEKKGTSLSTKLSTVGHGKELEGKLKTIKLQEEKSSLPSSLLSTTDLEEKLGEVCVKLIRLRKEGILAVPKSSTSHLVKKLAELCMELTRLRMEGTLPPPELFTANLEEELEELQVTPDTQRYENRRLIWTLHRDVRELLRQLQEKRTEALENTMYPTIRSGLVMFDVSLPEGLWSYVISLFIESAKLSLRKRALHSLSSVEELREAMDRIELKTFLGIHIREGAWQVALLFMDELSSDELPQDWFDGRRWEEEEEEMIGSSLYSSTSGILKAWPTEYDPDLVTLCKAITDMNWKVTRLIFTGSRISDEGLKNLSTALTQGELYSLTLYRSGLQSPRLKHLCGALISRDCNLTSLNVSANGLGDEGIMYLCNVLTSVNCKLTSLNVSHNLLEDEGIMRLCNVITSVNCKLTSLNFSQNRLGASRIRYLCNVLTSVNCKLTSLNVSGNSFGSVGVLHLCVALVSTNCTLTSLNVSGNWLWDNDIMHLFIVLTSSNCTLTRLKVRGNRVGDRAVKELARALTNKNCALTSLDISFNRIGDEGIKYLCKGLTDPNCKLRSLDLRENGRVTYVGKQCLSEAITGTDWEVRGGLVLSRSIKSEA